MHKFYVEHYKYVVESRIGLKNGITFSPDDLFDVMEYIRKKNVNFNIKKDLPFCYNTWRKAIKIEWMSLKMWRRLVAWLRDEYDIVIVNNNPERRF